MTVKVDILHTLTAAEGLAVRGSLCELGDRLYGLAGECGPNGAGGCNAGATWHAPLHTQQCPGSLFSLRFHATKCSACCRIVTDSVNRTGETGVRDQALLRDGLLHALPAIFDVDKPDVPVCEAS